jgi:hypothetical protein
VVGRALRVRNSVTKCAFLAPVIARRFCNGPLISQHFQRPVTPEVAGSSPVAPAMISKGYGGGIIRLRVFRTGALT